MSLSASDQSKLIQFRYEHAALAFQFSIIKLGLALDRWLDHAFNPNQPRVPAGHPDGGQWTDGDDAGVIPVADNDRPGGDRHLNPHIMAHHVGKNDRELIDRIRRSQYGGFFYDTGIDRNGSFASVESAQDFIKRTIDMNPEAVLRVASGRSRREFLTHRFGFETGREAYVDPPDIDIIRVRRTYEAGVVIVHDPNSELGYRIRTAYPRNYYPPIGR